MGGGRCRVQKRRHREILEFGQVVNQLRPEGCRRQNRGRSSGQDASNRIGCVHGSR